MTETFDKDDANGSPFKLPRNSMALPPDDTRDEIVRFIKEYELSET